VIQQAEGDGSRFRQLVGEYNKAPQVTRDRLYIETVEHVLSNTTKVIVDQKGSGNLLYLPLDRIMQMGTARPAEPPAAKSEPAPQPDQSTARSRDAFRSREREPR
jgi:membrane protease subunit HflK